MKCRRNRGVDRFGWSLVGDGDVDVLGGKNGEVKRNDCICVMLESSRLIMK